MSWYQFLYDKKKILVIIVCAILLGMLYSGYQVKSGHVSEAIISSYMRVDTLKAPLSDQNQNWQTYFWQSMSYLKKIGLVWICGLSGYLLPIGIVLALIYIFSYSYTCMTMLTVLEMSSYGTRIIYIFICSAIMTSYLALLVECLLKRKREETLVCNWYYMVWLIGGVIISVFLTYLTIWLW